MRSLIPLILLLSFGVHGQTGSWTSPTYETEATSSSPFSRDSIWPVGSTQVVAFSAPWPEWRLQLWQQALGGGSASLSFEFEYNQTEGEMTPQSFNWQVQPYELQLATSPVFFFWLYANGSQQQSSAYFNITEKDNSSPSTSTSSTSVPATTTSSFSTTATSPTTTAFPASSNTPTTSSSSTPNVSQVLSPGAVAGVGVGASIGGALVLAIVGWFVLRRRKVQREWQRRPELQGSQYPKEHQKPPVNPYYQPYPVEAPAYEYRPPVELGS
ncbi:hypothetical protein F5Y16DRAFT_286235 [Xylariaceae sp. FL0255]|nr:hypothetical protein F5Y16DRAFT_286235 [Xylariaceae sp. FL0255]